MSQRDGAPRCHLIERDAVAVMGMLNLRLLSVAGVLLVAACASRQAIALPTAGESRAITPTDGISTATPGVVPWVDRPAPRYIEPTPTPSRFPTDAQACRAADLSASAGDVGAAAGTTNIRIEFTNNADSACVLLGHPSVAGVAADATITAFDVGHGSIIGDTPWPAANIAPGQIAAVNISSSDECPAAQRGEHRIYPTLQIGLPSGDSVDVASHGFDTACGVSVSQFGVPALAEPQEPVPSPLIAHMAARTGAHDGEDLVYTLTLRNRSDTAYPLTACPAYQEYVALPGGGVIDPNYYLNCDTVHEIPAGSAITYQMRLQLPAELGTGQAKFGWLIHGQIGPGTAEILQITN